MSRGAPPGPGVIQRLRRDPAALNYLVLAGAGLLVYVLLLLAQGNSAGAMIAVLLAVPGVLARWTSSAILVLLLTAYLIIDPGFYSLLNSISGFGWYWPRAGGGFDLEDVILAGALLAYTVGHYRLTGLFHQAMPDDPAPRRERDPANPPRRPGGLVGADELPRTLIVAGACVIVGQAAWVVLVLTERLSRADEPRFSTGPARFLLVAWVAGLGLMAVSAALVYLRSARMSRAEARLVLRDEFFQENRRETDRLQRWRKWYKERVAARRRAGK